MDFNELRREGAEKIVADIINCKNSLELLLYTKRAIELNEKDLRSTINEKIKIALIETTNRKILKLIKNARQARKFSYAPYSRFNVGASLISEDNKGKKKIFSGCNIENSAYGSTICAERTAAFKSVSEGYKKIHAYAVVGGFDNSVPKKIQQLAQKEYIAPCGSCRQVTNEFDANSCIVILARDTGSIFITTLEYLLPLNFGPKNLGVNALEYDRDNKK